MHLQRRLLFFSIGVLSGFPRLRRLLPGNGEWKAVPTRFLDGAHNSPSERGRQAWTSRMCAIISCMDTALRWGRNEAAPRNTTKRHFRFYLNLIVSTKSLNRMY